MNKINFISMQNQTAAISREGDGYALKNWSPCGFTSVEHTGSFEAFEGWDG